MGYCNSPPYAQRQADAFVREMRAFVRVYVDDFVVRGSTPDEHLENLDKFLTTLDIANVTISLKKSFVGFPGVKMLGYFVDGFGLASLEERVEVIRNIAEPTSLAALEHFLGVAGYLHDKAPRYS